MGGDETDGAALDEAPDHGLGADASVVRVGAVENLVEEEEHRGLSLGELHHLPQAQDLGVEVGDAVLERVLDADRGRRLGGGRA